MNGLSSIADTGTWYAICIIALILFVGSLAVVFRFFRDKRNRVPIFIAILNLLLISVTVVILMDCGHSIGASPNLEYTAFQYALFELPYFAYVLMELLCCIIILLLGIEGTKYRSMNITPDAIQQAIDALPEAVAVCSLDGTVRLSNLKMSNLVRTLTGRILTDSNEFWSYVVTKGKEQGGQYLIYTPGEAVWLFGKEKLSIDGKEHEQITAMNVTARYAIIKELEAKNERLQDIRARMKAVSDLSGDMFIAQEEADARAALHNQLGQVLLMGRHYIEHQDTTDPQIVYAATMQMNRFLLGEAKDPYEGEDDSISRAMTMAGSIGVKVEISGAGISNEDVRKILSKAITECAANTIKHAEGDKITIIIGDNEFYITNNGKPPKGTITESGGLLSLRREIEAIGGTMRLDSDPGFKLTITY